MGNFVNVYSEEPEQARDFASASQQTQGAAALIYAFEEVCRAHAQHQATVEIYLDEDLTPDVWSFVWDAGPTSVGLPLCESGSPAAGYWDSAALIKYIGRFAAVCADSPSAEIEELLAVLRPANAAGKGVYVFFNE